MRGAERLDDERLGHLEDMRDARQQQESIDKSVTPPPSADAPQVPTPETQNHMADSEPSVDDRKLKLFIVRVSFEYMALAADELEAEDFAREAINDSRGVEDFMVKPWSGVYPCDWDGKCLVYHGERNDVTVAEAIAIHEAQSSPPMVCDAETRSAAAPSHDSSVEMNKEI